MDAKRVLVVDDEQVLRDLYSEVLSEAGYSVMTAASGVAALALVAAQPFDLVVTDYRMEGMDGIELVRRLKRARSQMPVILLTSHIGPTTALEALRAGAFWYLTKPVEVDTLIGKAGEALAQQARQS
jgi:CheY-like chemotaxis protein